MRRAMVDIPCELVAMVARVMADHGLKITGSCNSPQPKAMSSRMVRLQIEGEALPEECDRHIRLVDFKATTDEYGEQRIHKITEIVVIDKLTEVSSAIV